MLARIAFVCSLVLIGVVGQSQLTGDEEIAAKTTAQANKNTKPSPKPAKSKDATSDKSDAPKSAATSKYVPLNAQGTVLLDAPGKRLLLKAKVVLQQGPLEMLCCIDQTKEHESILSIDTKAYVVHTGLLALGTKAGSPVRYDPEKDEVYPPNGQRVDVFLHYNDADGNPKRVPAQSWIRHSINRFYSEPLKQIQYGVDIPRNSELRFSKKHQELSWYGPMSIEQRESMLSLSQDRDYRRIIHNFYKLSQSRPMKSHWVFAGSGFYTDEKSGQQAYQAEGGDLICVANFSTAMLDVTIPSSSQGTESLLYEAYSERIPPRDTEVTIELVPVFEEAKK